MKLAEQALVELQLIGAGGGWLFWALVVLAFAIAYSLIGLWASLRFADAPLLSPRDWSALLSNPDGDSESFQRLSAELSTSSDLERQLHEIEQRLFSRPDRRFPFVFVMISAAPLIGLLGTVSGMFKTFEGMSTNTTNAPIDVISEGIFEALITTEAGLVIGVPTFILCAILKSRYDSLIHRYHQLGSRLLREANPTLS